MHNPKKWLVCIRLKTIRVIFKGVFFLAPLLAQAAEPNCNLAIFKLVSSASTKKPYELHTLRLGNPVDVDTKLFNQARVGTLIETDRLYLASPTSLVEKDRFFPFEVLGLSKYLSFVPLLKHNRESLGQIILTRMGSSTGFLSFDLINEVTGKGYEHEIAYALHRLGFEHLNLKAFETVISP
ncbi:MAG: hypothetical protein JWQ35_1663, partial [Bacteriovoracaceae bacterium]|nr:hypothetical protein [Bacteriovoracaceae bacterium]